jgi:hypothetical protein
MKSLPLLALSGLAVINLPVAVNAQEGDFTFEVGEVPLLVSGLINPLATLTITETDPTAFDDGYFRLAIIDNVELRDAYFGEASAATGAVGPEGAEPNGLELVIQVDANDHAIDSITVQPWAFFRIGLADIGNEIRVLIRDGEAGTSVPEGDTSGISATSSYVLGLGSNLFWRELLTEDVPDMKVGQTLSIPIDPASDVFDPLEVTILTPDTIRAAIVDDQLVITGIAVGAAEFELTANVQPVDQRRRYYYSASFSVKQGHMKPPKPHFPGHKPPFFGGHFPPRGGHRPFGWKNPPWGGFHREFPGRSRD